MFALTYFPDLPMPADVPQDVFRFTFSDFYEDDASSRHARAWFDRTVAAWLQENKLHEFWRIETRSEADIGTVHVDIYARAVIPFNNGSREIFKLRIRAFQRGIARIR